MRRSIVSNLGSRTELKFGYRVFQPARFAWGSEMRHIAFIVLLVTVCADAKALDKRGGVLAFGLNLINDQVEKVRLDINETLKSAAYSLAKN